MRSPSSLIWRAVALVLLLAGISSAAMPQHGHVKSAVINYTGLHPGQKAMAAVVVEVDEGYHAQSHTPLDPSLIPFEIKPSENPAVTFGAPEYPAGKIEEYPALGKL